MQHIPYIPKYTSNQSFKNDFTQSFSLAFIIRKNALILYSFSEEKEVQNGLFYHFIYKTLVVNWSNMLHRQVYTRLKQRVKTSVKCNFLVNSLCVPIMKILLFLQNREKHVIGCEKLILSKNDDTSFLQKLITEIPAFLYFLQHRQLTTDKKSRMQFSPQQILPPYS